MSKNTSKKSIKNSSNKIPKTKYKTSNSLKNKTNKDNLLTEEDKIKIKEAFELFDIDNTGKIDPSFVRKAMDDMEYEKSNPLIYKIILNLDTPENEKKGINYNQFLQSFNDIIGDQNSKDGVQRIYNEFIFDSESETITPEILKSVSEKIGNKLTDEEIKIIFENASSNGKDISFEDFYKVIQNSHL